MTFIFRLNIPPFVPARTVLEGLESEDDQEQPVKHEILDAKVERTATAGGSPKHSLVLFRLQTMLCFMFSRLQAEPNSRK